MARENYDNFSKEDMIREIKKLKKRKKGLERSMENVILYLLSKGEKIPCDNY